MDTSLLDDVHDIDFKNVVHSIRDVVHYATAYNPPARRGERDRHTNRLQEAEVELTIDMSRLLSSPHTQTQPRITQHFDQHTTAAFRLLWTAIQHVKLATPEQLAFEEERMKSAMEEVVKCLNPCHMEEGTEGAAILSIFAHSSIWYILLTHPFLSVGSYTT